MDLALTGVAEPHPTDPCSVVSCDLHTLEFGHGLVQSSGGDDLIKRGQFGGRFSYKRNNQSNGLQPQESLFPRMDGGEEGSSTRSTPNLHCLVHPVETIRCRFSPIQRSARDSLMWETERGAPASACLLCCPSCSHFLD